MLTTEDLKKRLRREESERKVKTKAKKTKNKNKELKTNMKIWKFPQMTNLLRTNYVVNSNYDIK